MTHDSLRQACEEWLESNEIVRKPIWKAEIDALFAFAKAQRREGMQEAANWLRRNANAETNIEKRAAFIEAHNAIEQRIKELE